MPSEENKAVVRRFIEDVFAGGNLDLVDEIFDADYVLHDPSVPDEVRGPEGIRRYVSMYRSAYPDTNFTIEDQIAEGDNVATRWTGRGTHQGELMGIPPTGNQVTITGIELDRVVDGKLRETRVIYDAMSMMQQLAVIPQPGEPPAG